MTTIPNVVTFLDQNTVQFQRILDVELERLWKAITVKEELDQWFMTTEIDLRVGGHFSLAGGWDGVISALKPLELMQFDNEDGGITRFEIAPISDGGSSFTLTDQLPSDYVSPFQNDQNTKKDQVNYNVQIGGPGTHWAGVIAGWHGFVDGLEGYLKNLERQASFEAYNRLCQLYHEYLTEHYAANPPK